MRRPSYTSQANNTGIVISTLRKKKNFTQEEFGLRLADYLHRQKPFSISSVSAWELGRKRPSDDILVGISGLFGVPVEDLLGGNKPGDFTTDNDSPSSFIDYDIPMMADRIIVSSDSTTNFNELKLYHKRPVFLVFPDKTKPDQWAIVNFRDKTFALMDEMIGFWDCNIQVFPMEAYPIAEQGRQKSHPLAFARMMSLTQVWVEMNTADDAVRAKYNGWYVHNKNHDSLVNIQNGNVLPDRGVGSSFRVYSEPYDVIERDIE